MGIRMTTPMSEVNAIIQAEMKRMEASIIQTLITLGNLCVREIRDRAQEDSWFNRTGNLRSSVGYVVVAHGSIVKTSDFGTVLQGSEGSKVGKTLAEELAGNYPSGFALVVVAGMHYAEYVQAKNGNVTSSAELLARKELPYLLNKLKNQAIK